MLDRAWVWRDSNVRYFRVESVLFYVESSDVYHRVKPYPCTAGQGNGVPLNKNQTQGSGRFPFIEIKYGGRNYNFDSTRFVAKAAKQIISIYKRWCWCYFVKITSSILQHDNIIYSIQACIISTCIISSCISLYKLKHFLENFASINIIIDLDNWYPFGVGPSL